MTTLLADGRGAADGGPSSGCVIEVRLRRPAGFRGNAFSFPCDPQGNVDINALDDVTRRDYLFARILARLGQAQFWFDRERGSRSAEARQPIHR